MSGELSPIDKAKFVAAKQAAQFVEDGMRVGLGTGSMVVPDAARLLPSNSQTVSRDEAKR